MLSLYNTLTKKQEPFAPRSGNTVGLYTCGPTVYNYAHIGNLRTYVFEDILRRVLEYHGYHVRHVMNITDVGHLTDDADQGEDKMEKGARREGKTAWEIAAFYTRAFQRDIAVLNIHEPHVWCKATDHIQEQIDLVQKLIDKGFTYETEDGIYFDTTKIDDYGKLVALEKQELRAGARVEMGDKKNPNDFALWKFSRPGEARQMEWDAFGKYGFPGWHIECSAMGMAYLGEQFDIHCGGIDHAPVHHTNEIAQSESATGKKPWVNYWLHGEFLLIDHATGEKAKMAKSGENFITLATLKERGIDPLAYRYFLLQTHYRKQLTFSWDALEAAAQALKRLRRDVNNIQPSVVGDMHLMQLFEDAIGDDLNMPEALAVLWSGLKENKVTEEMAVQFDKIFGLDITIHADETVEVPPEVQALLDARAVARERKDWDESDRLRDEVKNQGFGIEDTDGEQKAKRL